MKAKINKKHSIKFVSQESNKKRSHKWLRNHRVRVPTFKMMMTKEIILWLLKLGKEPSSNLILHFTKVPAKNHPYNLNYNINQK